MFPTINTPPPVLDGRAREELLALTRATLVGFLATGQIPDCSVSHADLHKRSGAFVSLHRSGDLRGCIGLLSDAGELYRTVQRCVLSAALEDMRFSPVTLEEVTELKIEISVLTPLQRITDVRLIEVGRHGLVIARGSRRGLLLPQVAAKYEWDRTTFLAETCRKAGLPENAWSQQGTAIHIFEAQVFSE